MEPTNQPSPYFARPDVPVPGQTIDISDYSVVEDQIHPLRDYWLMAKRHRWLILSCALVALIAAALHAYTRTPLYTAEATLLIERKAPQILNLRDANSQGADFNDYNNEFYKTQYEILKSRALAERVVRDEGLENHPLFGGGKKVETTRGLISGLWQEVKKSAQGVVRGKADTQNPKPNTQDPIPLSTRLAGQYLSMLEVRPVAGTSLVTIKITSPDPALSARLADAHASSYVRYGIDLRSQTNDEAADFLQQKLVELKERIEQSEAALNSYRKEKGIISVDDKSNVIIDRLLDLNKSLTAAEGERIAWEAQVRAARGRSPEEIPAVRGSMMIGSLKAELAKFEAEYASLAKEFKAGYPPLDNLRARIDDTRSRISTEVGREVKSIEAGYAAASNKESQLRAAMDEQKRATLSLKDSAVQYAILSREVDTNKQLYDGVLSRLKEIGVAGEVRNSNIHVMGKAIPPGGPSYPDKRRMMMLGLLLGIGAGIGLAFLLEQLDNTLKSPEEAERYLRLANLGLIPEFAAVNSNGKHNGFVSKLLKSAHAELPVSTQKNSKDPHGSILLDHDPLSVVTEAYRSFRSALLLSQAGGPPHSMLVTSAGRGDGKTTTLVNTAIVFSQLGIRVVIVDADLRRPCCHMLLRMENRAGLSDLLAGQLELDEAIRPTTAENLFLISAGALPPNPAELLGSVKMHELLERLRQRFEFVFIDSTPILAVTDSVFLSTMVDGTLLVVNSATPKPLVKKARARLALSHSKVLGMLLNRVDIHNNEYGGYYQQYYTYYREDRSVLANGVSHNDENGNGGPAHEPATAGGNGHARPERNGRRNRKSAGLTNGAAQGAGSREQGAWSGEQGAGEIERTHIAQNKLDIVHLPILLQKMQTSLLHAMGPMAPFLIRENVRALGESVESFPAARLAELVTRLSKEIPTDSARARFQEEMVQEMRRRSSQTPAASQPSPVIAAAPPTEKLTNGEDAPASTEKSAPKSDLSTKAPGHDRVPAELFQIVHVKLREAMGPLAAYVLRDHIRALHESPDSFPAAKLEDLLQRLRKEIINDRFLQRFNSEMDEEIKKLGGRLLREQSAKR
jgi:polysaccharide biosynthesis transport protein